MNLIVLVADTFRWDHLSGICRQSKLETPFVEAFSKRCTIFDEHYAGSIPTLPNRTDCFTGRFHLATGGGWGPLREDVPTLASLMNEAGYRTQLITSTPHLVNKNNYYQRDFQYCEWIRGSEEDRHLCPGNAAQPPADQIQPHEKARHTYYIPGWHIGAMTQWMHGRYQCEEDYVAPQLALTVSKWLEWNHADGPFFLWVDSFDPHEPWTPPEYFRRRFDPDYDGLPMTHPTYGPIDVYTKRELANLQANYKAHATFADKWLGYMLQKIVDLDLLRDTAIVFTSDHGIYLGEHARAGKDNHYDDDDRHWPVYEEVSHIPLMVYHPEVANGRRVKGFTQPVDMTRTLLDLAQAPVPAEVQGHSLVPQVLGSARRGPRKLAVTGRSIENPAAVTHRWLYHPLGENRKPALYDRKADPHCRKNVYRTNRDQAAKLRKLVVEEYRACGATDDMIAAFEAGQPFAIDHGLTVKG